MSLHRITTIAGLHRHLEAAMQLEHATIPPYLTALYSIRPGMNAEAFNIIRVVAVEEMLHLTLAGNLLNAVGGKPNLTAKGFVPDYPAFLPDGESDFKASLQPFSKAAIHSFLQIERPAKSAHHETLEVEPLAAGNVAVLERHRSRQGAATLARPVAAAGLRAATVDDNTEEHFFSIGEFYKAIEEGLDALHAEHGDALFCGDPRLQVTGEYYYSGGGELTPVTDLASAKAAIRLISEQGEGYEGEIFDHEGEISHYYRFEQLLLGRYYQRGDDYGKPTGGIVPVDWDAIFPIKTNCKLSDYPAGSDLCRMGEAFNREYATFLGLLTRAFQGEPEVLMQAVGDMFRLKDLIAQLMRQPLGSAGSRHAAPTFEMP
jgi:hypothetical protein